MKSFLAHVRISLKLTGRDRMVLFFNYAFPLIFFFFFGATTHADQGGSAVYVVSIVLTMGVLGNGFFGAGIRAAMDREQNILRRFKVAPITPAPILFSSLATGIIIYLPAVVLILWLAHSMWNMPLPHLLPFFIFITVSLLAFRALGLIIASSVNSMQESQVLIQLLYLPMLLLSIMPVSELPNWAQVTAEFVPAGYLQTGMQGMLVHSEGLAQNIWPLCALLLTAFVGTFISMKLFRWDKDEKVRPAAKLWIVAVLLPFVALGAWQLRTRETLNRARVIERNLSRSQRMLIRNVRIFVGDGTVIESGAVLIGGKIERIFQGASPDAKELKAEAIEGAGKTLLPGLIDAHVHLSASGGFSDNPQQYSDEKGLLRELAAYIYSGVTTVRSVGDPLDSILKTRATVNSGEKLGAELFTCGPVFTVEGGHGTEYFKDLPDAIRRRVEAQNVRTPATPDEARQQVRELKARGIDCIRAILDSGTAARPFKRLGIDILTAIASEAHAQSLPLAVDTGDARDVAEAVAAGANSIEQGSFRDTIPDDVFTRMKQQNIAYDPTLAAAEALLDIASGDMAGLDRPLVQQVVPAALIHSTRQFLAGDAGKKLRAGLSSYGVDLTQGRRNLVRAWQLGVTLVTGTGSGSPLIFHGPAVHHELQLWVEAGIPAAIALQSATSNGARLLGIGATDGLIKPGNDADLMLVDGNPLTDIHQTEAISQIIFKGERISRANLFDQE